MKCKISTTHPATSSHMSSLWFLFSCRSTSFWTVSFSCYLKLPAPWKKTAMVANVVSTDASQQEGWGKDCRSTHFHCGGLVFSPGLHRFLLCFLSQLPLPSQSQVAAMTVCVLARMANTLFDSLDLPDSLMFIFTQSKEAGVSGENSWKYRKNHRRLSAVTKVHTQSLSKWTAWLHLRGSWLQ